MRVKGFDRPQNVELSVYLKMVHHGLHKFFTEWRIGLKGPTDWIKLQYWTTIKVNTDIALKLMFFHHSIVIEQIFILTVYAGILTVDR